MTTQQNTITTKAAIELPEELVSEVIETAKFVLALYTQPSPDERDAALEAFSEVLTSENWRSPEIREEAKKHMLLSEFGSSLKSELLLTWLIKLLDCFSVFLSTEIKPLPTEPPNTSVLEPPPSSTLASHDLLESKQLIYIIKNRYGEGYDRDAESYISHAKNVTLAHAALYYAAYHIECPLTEVAKKFGFAPITLRKEIATIKKTSEFSYLAKIVPFDKERARLILDKGNHNDAVSILPDDPAPTDQLTDSFSATSDMSSVKTTTSMRKITVKLINGLLILRTKCKKEDKRTVNESFCLMLNAENPSSRATQEKTKSIMKKFVINHALSVQMFDKLLNLFNHFVTNRPFGNELLINDISRAFAVSEEEAKTIINAINKSYEVIPMT